MGENRFFLYQDMPPVESIFQMIDAEFYLWKGIKRKFITQLTGDGNDASFHSWLLWFKTKIIRVGGGAKTTNREKKSRESIAFLRGE